MKVWRLNEENGQWELRGEIKEGNKAGEVWAVALDTEGEFLASTTVDGRVNVWDIRSLGKSQGESMDAGKEKKFREYETKGSFGLCVDISRDGKYTASGHQNGAVYVFDNEMGKLVYSLPGKTSTRLMTDKGRRTESKLTRSRIDQASPHGILLARKHTFGRRRRQQEHRSLRRQAR